MKRRVPLRREHTVRRRRFTFSFVVLSLLGLALPSQFIAPAAADPIVPVTVTISKLTALVDPDPAPLQGEADMRAIVAIDGFPAEDRGEITDDADIEPFWVYTRNVDAALSPIVITIEVKDNDTALAAPDDILDINPVDNKLTLTIVLDVNTGNWSFGGDPIPNNGTVSTGDGDTEHAGIFEGGERTRISLDISTASASGDADGDGLLDGWETRGFDADGDGTIDVNLPAFGADPLHKDLFLELDYEAGQSPNRASIQAMKNAFAAAPLTNPDGVNGVNAWIDTGNLVDGSAREGQAPNTCNDGINNGGAAGGPTDGGDTDCVYVDASVEDPAATNCNDNINNDGDALIDAADPDCLVGDNLGGGSVVPTVAACNLDSTFYAAKGTNFNAAQRRWIFRYAVSLALAPSCPSSGGWGEIGGNDFMDFNHDGGTILHELGHTLNLRHGGNEDNNCKPNYVSGMNYDNQFGIQRVGGGTIIDYSPPRRALNGSTRGNAPIANLVENDLDDGFVLDGSDANNRYVFVDPTGTKVPFNLNQGADWNSDADPPNESNQTINIDTNATGGGPAACANGSNNDTLEGFHDWNQISIPFRQFGDSADGAINPVTTPEPTLSELLDLQEDLDTTDLQVSISDSPDPVAAGTQLTYTVTVKNNGPNPASSVQVVHTLPGDVSFSSASAAGCAHAAGVVTCNLGEIVADASQSITVVVDVPADLVYDNGGPKTISSSASVSNLDGPDSNGANNTASTTTQVVAVADVKINSVTTTSPLEVLIGTPSSASIDVSVQNDGPSSPIDTVLSGTASSTAGASVTPANTSAAVNALTSTARTVSQNFTLTCTSPGLKTMSFSYSLALKNTPVDIDPDLTNNSGQASFQIDCVVPIAINVRPGGFPNSINLNTDATLAALTTAAGEYGLPLAFDASTIQAGTVRWGLRSNLFNVAVASGAPEIHTTNHLERSYELDERTRDGDLDGVMHFKPALSGLTSTSTEACLKGKFLSGGNLFTFLGCDSVRIRP
jgi:uncharacterized repeat protein (TIGR01451 family)